MLARSMRNADLAGSPECAVLLPYWLLFQPLLFSKIIWLSFCTEPMAGVLALEGVRLLRIFKGKVTIHLVTLLLASAQQNDS